MQPFIRVLLCVLVWSGTFLVRTQAAPAGLIIWQKEKGEFRHDHLIEIIQGHKEWLALSSEPHNISHVVSADVVDLDTGVSTTMFYKSKIYFVEKPFPMPIDADTSAISIGELKPTGRFRKIAGYSCEEYVGSGESNKWGRSTEETASPKVRLESRNTINSQSS